MSLTTIIYRGRRAPLIARGCRHPLIASLCGPARLHARMLGSGRALVIIEPSPATASNFNRPRVFGSAGEIRGSVAPLLSLPAALPSPLLLSLSIVLLFLPRGTLHGPPSLSLLPPRCFFFPFCLLFPLFVTRPRCHVCTVCWFLLLIARFVTVQGACGHRGHLQRKGSRQLRALEDISEVVFWSAVRS